MLPLDRLAEGRLALAAPGKDGTTFLVGPLSVSVSVSVFWCWPYGLATWGYLKMGIEPRAGKQ